MQSDSTGSHCFLTDPPDSQLCLVCLDVSWGDLHAHLYVHALPPVLSCALCAPRMVPHLLRLCAQWQLSINKYMPPTFILGGRPEALDTFRIAFSQAKTEIQKHGGRLSYVAHPAKGSGGPGRGDGAKQSVLVDTIRAVENLVDAQLHPEVSSAAHAWVVQQVAPRCITIKTRPVTLRFVVLVDPNLKAWLYKRGHCRLGLPDQYRSVLRRGPAGPGLSHGTGARSMRNGAATKQLWSGHGPTAGMKSFEELSEAIRQELGVCNFMDKLLYNVVPQVAEITADIVAAVLASFGDHCRGTCFELFGFDFSLTEEFVPLLLGVERDPNLLSHHPTAEQEAHHMINSALDIVIAAGTEGSEACTPLSSSQRQKGPWDFFEKLTLRAEKLSTAIRDTKPHPRGSVPTT